MREKIQKLFGEFVNQEGGNKVTNFNMSGLLVMLIDIIEKADQEREKARQCANDNKKELKPELELE